jgi:MaoC dehydratase-like protein
MPKKVIGNRVFTLESQLTFAEFSGDRNPIHISEQYARKTATGQPIVYGMFAVLWALSVYEKDKTNKIDSSFDIQFLRPILLGEKVNCHWSWEDETLTIENETAALVKIKFLRERFGFPILTSSSCPKTIHQLDIVDRQISDIKLGDSFRYPEFVRPELAEEYFPALCDSVGRDFVVMLANLSAIIGMYVPGLNSIFVSAKIRFQEIGVDKSIHINKIDERFSLVELQANNGNMKTQLRAIFRARPIEILGAGEMLSSIPETSLFLGKRVLIIGGTRGLGGHFSKILALMGANVFFTYNLGSGDALEVIEDLESVGVTATCQNFDVLKPNLAFVRDVNPNYLFYFASPKIFAKRSKDFEVDLFDKFQSFYVKAFERIAVAVSANATDLIYYPSSVAIDNDFATMPEYATAKQNGENAAKRISELTGIDVLVDRLPRTLTDQTATHFDIGSKDPFKLSIEIIQNIIETRKTLPSRTNS